MEGRKTVSYFPHPRFYTIGRATFARLGHRIVLSPVLVICLLLSLSACDLSFLFGGKKTDTTPAAAPPASSPSLISSYACLAANNPSLGKDYTATITAPNVYITLPYSVIQSQTPLTPTVSLTSGYTISPTGSYVPADGMTVVLTNAANNTVSNYTLHVAVDPGSIAFLQLANPFYIDNTGTKQTMPAAQYVLSLAAATNTYSLTLQTDQFSLPYVMTAVQGIITGRLIGFTTATVPYGSFTTNLSNAIAGAVCPYTVAVQSPNKATTNTFTVQASRTKSNVVALTDVSATVTYVYSYTTTQSFSDSTLANFLSAMWEPAASDTITADPNGTGTTPSEYAILWNDITTNGAGPYTGAVSNATVFESTGGTWYDQASSNFFCQTITSSSQINSNVSAINNPFAAPVNGVITNGSGVIDFGTSYTINSTITSPSNLPPVLTPTLKTITLGSVTQCSVTIYSSTSVITCYDSQSINIPISNTQTFTPLSYPEFQTIVVKFPSYDTINAVVPSALVTSFTKATSSDGLNWVLTFNMVPTTNHVTGNVATLVLGAESGNTATYNLTIN